jgi:hypothetical protein
MKYPTEEYLKLYRLRFFSSSVSWTLNLFAFWKMNPTPLHACPAGGQTAKYLPASRQVLAP